MKIEWEAWTALLLQAMQWFQQGVLQLLAGLGLTGELDGQPAWPFALRLSGEVALIDGSVARALLIAVAATLAALAVALLALALPRLGGRTAGASIIHLTRIGRPVLAALALTLLLLAPWPDSRLLTTEATPTSFHRSTTGFSAGAIVRGERIYRQQCAGCHGLDGKGNTPQGLSLPVAPPNLASGLLWRRSDGDLYWSLRHGKGSMPAFARRITPHETWALLDYLKAHAAGVGIAETGAWPRPVALPDMRLDCRAAGVTQLRQWRGQRVRLLVPRSDWQETEDPRLQSVVLTDAAKTREAEEAGESKPDAVGRIACSSNDPDALHAIAIITGAPQAQLTGTTLLADRDGWLRARNSGGAWSQDDMLCRSPTAPRQEPIVAGTVSKASAAGGIEPLIAAMDADPVRFIKGGFFH